MKQEKNNEIDLLLRRLSRRQEVPLTDVDSDHLDVDELSAYAENALPASARARYTEHLADCSKCREIVVQLSASVPVVAARETVTAAAPTGLLKFFASFFSPMVLRYAVPALALVVVAAIGFVVTRSRQAPWSASQPEHLAQRPAVSAEPQQSPNVFYDSNEGLTKSSSPAVTRQSNTEKPVATAEEPPPPSAPSSRDFASAKTDAPVQRPAEPAAANAAPARVEPAPTPAPTVDEMRVDIQGRKNEQSGPAKSSDLAKQKTAEGDQDKKVSEFQNDRERQAQQQPGRGATRPQAGRTTTLGALSAEQKDSDDGVVRSVAGRRFRKQSGIWVDTAYSSGSAITNVARGSEQYRSLVADEPEIKKIADALDGPFVVVWKGRTYRIR
jgi:Putative zinc-finger